MRDDITVLDFQKTLEARKTEILAARDSQKENVAPKELDQSRVGRLSRMDALQQQAMSKASEQLVLQELGRITTALSRIDSGDYGYCILCDDEIAEKRLRFDASLLTCITCAQEAENE